MLVWRNRYLVLIFRSRRGKHRQIGTGAGWLRRPVVCLYARASCSNGHRHLEFMTPRSRGERQSDRQTAIQQWQRRPEIPRELHSPRWQQKSDLALMDDYSSAGVIRRPSRTSRIQVVHCCPYNLSPCRLERVGNRYPSAIDQRCQPSPLANTS